MVSVAASNGIPRLSRDFPVILQDLNMSALLRCTTLDRKRLKRNTTENGSVMGSGSFAMKRNSRWGREFACTRLFEELNLSVLTIHHLDV
jgi:hypothetical protein